MCRGSERQHQQFTIYRCGKADPAICGLRRSVLVTCLDGERGDTVGHAEIPDLKQSGCTEAPVAPGRPYEEIIQASDETAVLHRIAESEDEMTDVLVVGLDQPDVTEALIGEDGRECRRRTG